MARRAYEKVNASFKRKLAPRPDVPAFGDPAVGSIPSAAAGPRVEPRKYRKPINSQPAESEPAHQRVVPNAGGVRGGAHGQAEAAASPKTPGTAAEARSGNRGGETLKRRQAQFHKNVLARKGK